jgi:hypothetical protein
MRRLRRRDWEAVAGIVAAVTALVLHLLHVADTGVLLAITLVILALMLLRDLRREERGEQLNETLARMEIQLHGLGTALLPPDAVLIGPEQLRRESVRFARQAQGEMVWFNVCLLMFVPQPLFNVLLRPAIENHDVSSIQFLLDEHERERWERDVLPKVRVCVGHEKVQPPLWCAMQESVSFILAGQAPNGQTEAHLSFWGEPFMSAVTGQQLPRYIFHVQARSELIGRLVELQRQHRVHRAQA